MDKTAEAFGAEPEDVTEQPPPRPVAGAAWWVAAGIFLSRIAGLVRTSVTASFFGTSAVADLWAAGLRIPNVIQNLLGEGTLSASFIPVYAELLHQGREEEAGRFAGAALGILTVVAFGAAAVGMLLAPLLIRPFFPTWEPWQWQLGTLVVRILFLMTALLVVSAWALGVLNSNRRFFVSYVAPVAWNVAIVATLVVFGSFLRWEPERLVVALAWGAVGGGVLQILVQLPWVIPVLHHFQLSVNRGVHGVQEAIRNFIPVVAARGVVNVAAILDTIFAGLLATGALAALTYAQLFYLLPISLFGMSIAASELPEMARERAGASTALVARVAHSLRRIAFLLVPSTVAYLVIGDVLVAAFLEYRAFKPVDSAMVYAVLAAYALGLLASSSSRVVSSAFYALRDTRTPARIAYVRIAFSIVVGLALMFPLDRISITVAGETRQLGAVGLALGASSGAWLEYTLLRRHLGKALGPHSPPASAMVKIAIAGAAAAAVGVGAKLLLGSVFPARPGWVEAWLGAGSWATALVLGAGTALLFGVTYLSVAAALGEGALIARLLRR